jgi:hypothetical protein
MTLPEQSKEKRILITMRKVLASIVKDTTPEPGLRHPLREQTIQDIRQCFKLISARERELAEAAGMKVQDRPRYSDQAKTTNVVSFVTIEDLNSEKSENKLQKFHGDHVQRRTYCINQSNHDFTR